MCEGGGGSKAGFDPPIFIVFNPSNSLTPTAIHPLPSHFLRQVGRVKFVPSNCLAPPVDEVVKDIVIGAGGLGFGSRAVQIGQCRHRCDVSVLPRR